MIRSAFVAAAAFVLANCSTFGVDAPLDIPDVGNGKVSEATMKEVVKTLASDEFEGRAPGTVGEEKTVPYLIERFKEAGLKPGNAGSWVQKVPLVEITGKDFAPLTVANGGTKLSFEFGSDWVAATYREESRIDLSASELVFVGYGINAPEKGWNDYEGLDVKGKTVVMLVNDPDFGAESLDGPFNGKAMTYYGRWTYKYEEAARQGAAAALIVHETAPASYGWNVVESSWSGPQAYAQSGEDAPAPTLMNGWIQHNVARKVFAAAGQDLDKLSAEARMKGFKAVPLGLTVSTSFTNDIRKFASQNVIGILPGSEAPDEYVLHSAHWDHLGHCKPAPDGDDICNGAIDNATGVAALVALAESHAKVGAPRRTMVFLAVTGEESGLLGSDYYAAHPVFPLAQTVGGINFDALYIFGKARDVTVIGGDKSELGAFLDSALANRGLVATPDHTPEAGRYYRSDHFSLAKRGVPMLYLKSGEDLVVGGLEAGKAGYVEYNSKHYHSPKDEYDESWDWAGVMDELGLFHRIGRTLAMSTSWPNWHEGDEFRAIRDESCAASDKGC